MINSRRTFYAHAFSARYVRTTCMSPASHRACRHGQLQRTVHGRTPTGRDRGMDQPSTGTAYTAIGRRSAQLSWGEQCSEWNVTWDFRKGKFGLWWLSKFGHSLESETNLPKMKHFLMIFKLGIHKENCPKLCDQCFSELRPPLCSFA